MVEDLLKLENSIKRGLISNIYLIYGEQDYLKDLAVNKIKDYLLPKESRDFNYDFFSDPVNFYQLVNSAEQLPVFHDKRMVVAKSQNMFSDAGEAGEEELIKYLNNPNPETCLVLISTKIDARRKVVKLIKQKGQTLHIKSPKADQLVSWIEKQVRVRGKKIEDGAVELLIAAVGDNLLMLEQEIEKAAIFSSNELISLEQIEQTVSFTASLNVFKITDFVTEKKGNQAVKLYQEMVTVGEHPIKILALLGRTFRQLLRTKLLVIQGRTSAFDLSRELKVAGFVAKKLFNQHKYFSLHQLQEAIILIKNTDNSIKTGQRDPVIAVELTIYRLSGGVQE